MEGGLIHYKVEDDNIKATELRLGLPGSNECDKPLPLAPRGSKRSLVETEGESRHSSEGAGSVGSSGEVVQVAKAQVVGWPPIQAYRRGNIHGRKREPEDERIYVKVSMDGAPYLRKIDLKVHRGYEELGEALEGLFKSFSLGEYTITYEDKDGDLMLVGDVPWEMFMSSCKRLRIMRGSEARGPGSTQ